MSDDRKYVDLKLSLKPQEEQIVSNVQKEIIKEDLERFNNVKENDVNISTSYVFDAGDKLEASVFFRNGLNMKIDFSILPLKLVNNEGEIVASQVFNLSDVGEIPPLSVRPYKLYFDKINIIKPINDIKSLKVMFDKNLRVIDKAELQYEDLPEDISIDEKRFFETYLNNLPIIEKGQVDLKCYDVRIKEEDKIKITIIIRNGFDKSINLEQLPITIYDNNKEVICSTVFKCEDLRVSSMKAKLCNFMVQCGDINLKAFDLDNLSVKFE